jgi:K+-sensing histidine kinase KdpD
MRTWSAVRTAVIGVVGVTLVLVALWPVNDRLDLSVPALLLLVPIVATSVFGDRRAATGVAVLAALGYAFGHVPPVGDLRPHVGRDVVTLVTFVAVGLACGSLARRGRSRAGVGDPRVLDANRAQLLRTVGHDLRNPLHTIRAVTSGLMSSADEDARVSLAAVAAESERLDRIVANMLSASRIEAGALLPDQAPEDLASLVHLTIDRLRPSLTQRLEIDVEPELPDVAVDAVQFDQVLTNLIENAGRHGDPDGVVAVVARRAGGVAALVVTDDGPGFTDDEIDGPVAFRAGPASRGSGLGLAVCRGILEAHGGTLTLANRTGGGAAVTVTLPFAG